MRLWLFLLVILTIGALHPLCANEDLSLEEEGVANDGPTITTEEGFPDQGDDPEVSMTEAAMNVPTVDYVPPSTEGLEFAETFDGEVFDRWIKSANEKFSGEWSNALRKVEAVVGDRGLRVMNEALHHGIATKLSRPMVKNQGKSIVVSYEVKFEEGLNCGGAYLKLFSTANFPSGKQSDLSQFDGDTAYSMMFGPDRCGATNKVHVIIKQLNPVSKQWVEHHLMDPPRPLQGSATHVYTFIIKPDNTYELLIDDKVEKSGDMKSDFQPPFTPPTEIPDPEDKKPENWVDEAQIPDESAVKPDDWDENAPRRIVDPDATMPEGWLVDEPVTVPDPNATQPEDWNEEEDGKWEAPSVSNPVCASVPGCGKWEPPMINNPKFKGKWYPPMITNPEYKGEWKAREIPNPDYFVSENPHALADFDAIGFELWTMQKGILFDNIVLSRSLPPVKAFIQRTWKVRHDIEASQQAAGSPTPPKEGEESGIPTQAVTGVMMMAHQRPVLFAVGVSSVVLIFIVLLIKMFKSSPETGKTVEEEKAGKKDRKSSEKDSEESEETEKESEGKAEVLTEKKVPEQTRQRRAPKKD